MIWHIAWRNIMHRPLRSLFLLVGYGLGVAVMIALLSVGEAMVTQASEERLVGGGDLTVLPDGIDVEVLKTGGLGGMFFSVPNARFVYQHVLASPRNADIVEAVAPQLDNKLLYLQRTRSNGAVLDDPARNAPALDVQTLDVQTLDVPPLDIPVRAFGELPSATRAVGAAPVLAAGVWENDDADNRWATPTLAERRHDIDRFHVPPADVAARESWGEWHYFNVLSDDATRWAFISFIVGGDVRGEEWGGQVLVTLHERGRPARRFVREVPGTQVRFSTTDADVRIGEASVTVREDGAYLLQGTLGEEGTGTPLALDVVVHPAPHAEFPGATLASGDFTSGYTVPGLRASATGSICVGSAAVSDARGGGGDRVRRAGGSARCDLYIDARAYHDHNWGVWQGVTWEWGAARAHQVGVLFGRVNPPDSLDADAPLFVYLTDSLGFVSLFRPRAVEYTDGRTVVVGGRTVRVPSAGVIQDVRGADTLRIELTVDDAVATDTRLGLADRGESPLTRQLARPYFVQMQGRVRIVARIRGVRTDVSGTGFFETYR